MLYKCTFVGLLLYVSVDVPYMPPLMVPSKHHNNYTAVIRVVVSDELAASSYVDVQFQVRIRCYRSDQNVIYIASYRLSPKTMNMFI